ncbi:MAG: phosphatidylinositol-specific phospholipase C domain-containing protein [Vibrionaceae bacterium]
MKTLSYLTLAVFCSFSVHASHSALKGEFESGYEHPYLHSSKAGYSNPDWMAAIEDSKQLNEISLPGTHNSLSRHGGDVPQTQSLDIKAQLEMGIRYFDARFKYRSGDLYAYHGVISQFTTFDEFLNDVSSFLDAYPSETVLIRMQNEGGAEEHEDEFFARFKEVLASYRHNNAIPYSNNPTLGDVRGKFVFIRDFNAFGPRIGIERGSLNIQDDYHLTTNWELYTKWGKIKDHFMNHANDAYSISVNYLSGSVGSFPYFVASGKSSSETDAPQLWTGVSTVDEGKYKDFPRRDCVGSLCSIYFAGTNQLAEQWILQDRFPLPLGIVAMDFPGATLVDAIIQSNDPNKELAPALEIFEHSNLQGQSLRVNDDISDLGNMNDKLSSWSIPDGWEVRFYTDVDFKGDYYTRSYRDGNHGEASEFNDKVRSIKILGR